MRDSRLALAIETGAVRLPDSGRITVFGARADADLSALPKDRVQIVQGFWPDHHAWAARGYDVVCEASGPCAAALIFLPRAKAEARAWVAQALVQSGGGPVILDGQKTDGIDSLFKAIRKRAAVPVPVSVSVEASVEVSVSVSTPLAKDHGKLFWMTATPGDFADWRAGARTLAGGYRTAPGVFSADAVDPGSALLADTLPVQMKGRVADLGAGWGYLAARVLATSQAITELHLIEAGHAALGCARANVADPRARFHWADATAFAPAQPFDVVISNPPFHSGRTADPALGLAFLTAAAGMLGPSGQLWLVANRHLPYEGRLAGLFRDVGQIAATSGYKILHATHPVVPGRRRR